MSRLGEIFILAYRFWSCTTKHVVRIIIYSFHDIKISFRTCIYDIVFYTLLIHLSYISIMFAYLYNQQVWRFNNHEIPSSQKCCVLFWASSAPLAEDFCNKFHNIQTNFFNAFNLIPRKPLKDLTRNKKEAFCKSLEGEYGFKVYLMHTFSQIGLPNSLLVCDSFQSLFIPLWLFAFV